MDTIIKLIETLPLAWKIVMVSIIVIGNLVYLFRKQIIKIFKKKEPTINLKEHKLFTEKSYLIHKIKMISLDSEKKSKLFQQLLLIKYEAIRKHAIILIENKELENISNKHFLALIIKNMTTIVDEYNEQLKFKFGEELFEMVMNHREKGFNIIHEKTVTFIKSAVDETFESDHVVFTTIEDKMDFLLDLYYIAMKIAMTDIDIVYNNFNGDLTRLLKNCKNCF